MTSGGKKRPFTDALLTTKLSPPLPGRGHVKRERLHDRMARASLTPITLLSAPAGFGKSSLLAGWLSELTAPWAWVSIDGRDTDCARLWVHMIAALQKLAGPVGEATLAELRRRGSRMPFAGWLTPLINDLADASAPEAYLVVDDLHLLTEADQRASLGMLAQNLPPWLHLVLSTRADPPLPLPRLRAEGRITEVREGDLRFVASEASSLLAASGMHELAADDVQALVERTEGWAAGLQLATITLGDPALGARFDDVVGSFRPFTDYLITEVVDHQTKQMRDFLYATATVDRVNPSLAAALSGDPDADRLLRQAEQDGLFLTALDGRDEWYRYHQLFAEALRHELNVQAPQAATDANSTAARWFEAHADVATALEHWLSAGRPEEALRLAIDVAFSLVDRGDVVTIESIARRIPASVPGDNPALQLDYGLLHMVFEPQAFLGWVHKATETIGKLDHADDGLVTQHLAIQAMADLSVGDWDDAFEHARAAIARTAGRINRYSQRSRLQAIRAAGWLEHHDDAESGFRSCVDDPSLPEPVRTMVAPAAWALASALAGSIDEAQRQSQAAALAFERNFSSMFVTDDLLLTRAVVARERGDGEAAAQAIDDLRAVGVSANFALRAVGEVEFALNQIDAGRFSAAAETLDSALLVRPDGPLGPRVRGRVDAARSSLCLASGDLAGARRAAGRIPPGLWKSVALVNVLLADGAYSEAEAGLRGLIPTTPRQQVVVDILRARSLADRDSDAANDHAVAALSTATAVGIYRTLVCAGPGVDHLIERASWAAPDSWVDHYHRAFATSVEGPITGRVDRLIEQPTARERNAARFLASRLTVPEIARELGVSPNTLKTHLKSLYRKLGVTSRADAVAAARELGILR